MASVDGSLSETGLHKGTNWWGAFVIGLAGTILVTGIAPYVVQGTGVDDRLPKMLPRRLADLLPKLHASDYDYIIFDMPPITQTSITPRLASFMDMVFMVESIVARAIKRAALP